jgi:hypothetical protein
VNQCSASVKANNVELPNMVRHRLVVIKFWTSSWEGRKKYWGKNTQEFSNSKEVREKSVTFIHQSAHHVRAMPPGILCGHAKRNNKAT